MRSPCFYLTTSVCCASRLFVWLFSMRKSCLFVDGIALWRGIYFLTFSALFFRAYEYSYYTSYFVFVLRVILPPLILVLTLIAQQPALSADSLPVDLYWCLVPTKLVVLLVRVQDLLGAACCRLATSTRTPLRSTDFYFILFAHCPGASPKAVCYAI